MKVYTTILILTLLSLFFINCSDRYDLPDNEHGVPVSFASAGISNSKPVDSNKPMDSRAIDQKIVLAEDNDSISVSMEEVPWDYEAIPETRTIWTNANYAVTWAAGDQTGIYMRYASGKTTTSNNVRYNTTTSAASSPLTPNSNRIVFPYPIATSNVKFYAYYPYAGVSSTTSPIRFNSASEMDSLVVKYSLFADQTSAAVLRNCDIMSAVSSVANGTSPAVSLAFNHQMVLLTIRVRTSLLVHTLSKVSLSGAAITGSGTLNLLTSTATPTTSSTFVPSVTTSQSTTTASVDLIINPCTITGNALGSQLTVSIQFSDLTGLPRTTNLITSGTFVKGTRYIYTITVVV